MTILLDYLGDTVLVGSVASLSVTDSLVTTSTSRSQRWLRLYSRILPFCVLLLIFVGSLVTSNEAGLSVPDWPTTYGQNMFLFPYSQWRGNIFYEHSHRLLASTIGFLTVILAVWIWMTEKRRWVRNLTYCALGAVILQGVLGGLTVIFLLPDAISISHAVLAQTFFVLTIIIAYSQSKEFISASSARIVGKQGALFKSAFLLAVVVYCQLILGAAMRHTASGLAVPDFPTMGGYLLPPFNATMLKNINSARFDLGLDQVTMGQVVLHLMHRLTALFVVIALMVVSLKALMSRSINDKTRGVLWLLWFIVMIQISLGIITVLSVKNPNITSLHVVTGAALLGLSVLLTLRSYLFNVEELNVKN